MKKMYSTTKDKEEKRQWQGVLFQYNQILYQLGVTHIAEVLPQEPEF